MTPNAQLERFETLVLKSEHVIRFFVIEGDVRMFQKLSFFGLIDSRRTLLKKSRTKARLNLVTAM